jgi:L-iditol 2-dehydrogenase
MGVSCDEYRHHGAFAEFVAVPQHVLYPLPPELPFEHAAMIEPVSVALHAVELLMPRGRVSFATGNVVSQKGPPVAKETRPLSQSPVAKETQPLSQPLSAVVVGSGMIGLLVIQALRVAGCGEVIAIDVDPGRIELARKLGATRTIDSKQTDAVAAVLEFTGGRGADVAIEAVGNAAAVDTAVRSVCRGGRVGLVGNVTPQVPLPLQIVVSRELTLLGCCASAGEYPRAIELVAQGAIRVEPLITARAPLADGPNWFERLYAREPGLMKVILQPTGAD